MTEKLCNLSVTSHKNKGEEQVQLVQMNIYQSNTCRKDLWQKPLA